MFRFPNILWRLDKGSFGWKINHIDLDQEKELAIFCNIPTSSTRELQLNKPEWQKNEFGSSAFSLTNSIEIRHVRGSLTHSNFLMLNDRMRLKFKGQCVLCTETSLCVPFLYRNDVIRQERQTNPCPWRGLPLKPPLSLKREDTKLMPHYDLRVKGVWLRGKLVSYTLLLCNLSYLCFSCLLLLLLLQFILTVYTVISEFLLQYILTRKSPYTTSAVIVQSTND